MVVLRRLTAVVTLLVTFLLVLTESGFACSGAAMGSGATGVSAGTPGMGHMADMAMPGRPSDAGQNRAPSQAPCRLPWAPTGCRDMAPCAPAALAVVPARPAQSAARPAALVAVHASAPASLETPPEPPPPRA